MFKIHPSRYFPAVLSGTALVFAFPTFNISMLAWICIVPFLISLYSMDGHTAFRAGLFFGLPYFFGTQSWIYYSVNHYGGVSLLPSLLIVLLLSLYESLYTAIFGFLFAKAVKRTDLPLTIIAAPLWCSLEYIRGYLFSGFPWSLLGYTQYNSLPIIQISDITGVYGVSFLIILVNASLADIYLLKVRQKEKPLFPYWKTLSSVAVTAVLIAATLLYGVYKLRSVGTEKSDTRQVRISIIQGSIEQDRKWNPAYQRKVFNIYKRLTLEALKENPDMVVWPETALPFYFGRDKEQTTELTEFVKKSGVPLLTGTVLVRNRPVTKNRDGNSNNGYMLSNSAVLINSAGKLTYTYDKIHLVPFGEYVPLKSTLFFLDKLVKGIGDYIPGKNYVKAELPWGQFGTIICYEAIFPGLVRKFFRHGGNLIVNITNDAWFGRTSGPYQHFSMSVFRAVENRKPLVRAANTGISGFIDATGKVLKKTGLFKETYITEDILINDDISFYTRFGDMFSFLNIIFTVLLFISLLNKVERTQKYQGGVT
ncbi:Apolipoprotein N-acyltransferase / Copper homeostasis protein CutE [hydrothermal vent metagenome]|uniref:Apolipoprotein N-acyltransferase / Copper homeostasis protein CutE n=1 Tax=hydrothermal vent metagenome TaxID=652676 RepID=A0A3B1D413_9ZZZZ